MYVILLVVLLVLLLFLLNKLRKPLISVLVTGQMRTNPLRGECTNYEILESWKTHMIKPEYDYEFYFMVDQIDETKARDFLKGYTVHINTDPVDADKYTAKYLSRIEGKNYRRYPEQLFQWVRLKNAFYSIRSYPDYVIRIRPDYLLTDSITASDGAVIMHNDFVAIGSYEHMKYYAELIDVMGNYKKMASGDIWLDSQPREDELFCSEVQLEAHLVEQGIHLVNKKLGDLKRT